MANPLPIHFGRYYHTYNRGINQENIFIEERNYRYFLRLFAHHVLPVVDVYAYCLLRNHFHFLVRVKTVDEIEPDLTGFENLSGLPSKKFSNLFNAYAKAVNKAYKRTGSLFQRPFGRVEVTSDAQLIYLVTYIHQNPQKHGFVDDFREWSYSSYHSLVSLSGETHLKRDDVIDWFGAVEDFEAAHQDDVDLQKIAPLVAGDFD